MRLYTINHKHADTFLSFTLTPSDVGSVLAQHPHEKSEVFNLSWKLSTYANDGHSHPALKYIAVVGNEENQITREINFVMVNGISLSISGSTLGFDVTPLDSVTVTAYFKNSNPSGTGVFGFLVGDRAAYAAYDVESKGSSIAFIEGM